MKKNQRVEVAYDHPQAGITTIKVHYMGKVGVGSFTGPRTQNGMKAAIKYIKDQIREAHNKTKSTH